MSSLATLLERSAHLHADRVALVECASDGGGSDEGGAVEPASATYGQLWSDARRGAAWLGGRIQLGDRVLLHLRNGREFVTAYYAVLVAGGVVVPLPAAATGAECAAVQRDSGARLVLTKGLLRYDDKPAAAVGRAAGDVAAILYTSGTSGDPKGVVLTHGNLLDNATVASRDVAQFTSEDVMLVTVQFAHAFGMTSVLNACLVAGATLVVPERWDAGIALELMRRHAVTVVRGVPTTYVDLLAALGPGVAGPTLRAAFSGGAAMSPDLLASVEKAFDTTVFEGYGLTEASPLVACNQRAQGRRPGTVGHPVPGVEVKIAEPGDGGPIVDAVGKTGEVVVRGPNVMAGYWNRPAESAAVLIDGWLRTGDIGAFDPDGFLRIIDRAKDVIKRGGAAVYPREVEDRLTAHPGVRAAAVVGVPDDRYGERVVAAVVRHESPAGADEAVADELPADEALAAELQAWCRCTLSSYKCPVDIRVVARLPLGPTGKVLKRELRAHWGEPTR